MQGAGTMESIPKEELQKTIAAEIQSFEDEHSEGETDKS